MGLIYTKETTDKLIEDYKAGAPVADLAAALGVSERSVRSKLSTLGVYKRKEYTNKNGQKPVKKFDYIQNISNLLEIDVDLLDSLEKATKLTLSKISEQLSKKLQ